MSLSGVPREKLVAAMLDLAAKGIEIGFLTEPDTRIEVRPGECLVREHGQVVARLDKIDSYYIGGLLIGTANGLPVKPVEAKHARANRDHGR